MKPSKDMSSWLILLVVLATAFVTSWAMLKFKPADNWNASSYYPAQQVAQNFSPGLAAMDNNWLLAAGGPPVPVILAGAVAPHPDRGVCTNCHTVVSSRQKPIPSINATATMPHEYRGVCSNCHQIGIQGGTTTNQFGAQSATPANPYAVQGAMQASPYSVQGAMPANPYSVQGAMSAAPSQFAATPVAAVRPLVTPGVQMPIGTQMPAVAQMPAGTQMARAGQPPARPATEGEWMGLEVTPITTLTATQYGIPPGTRGLVVTDAEAQAAIVGVKAGDVVVALNGMPISQMTEFFQATRNGTLTQATVELIRKDQRLAVNITQTPPPPPAVAAGPNTQANFPPAGMGQTMAPPSAATPISPVAAGRWGVPPTYGNAAAGSQPPVFQRQF